MERMDLRELIVPTVLENEGNSFDSSLSTTDMLYLFSLKELRPGPKTQSRPPKNALSRIIQNIKSTRNPNLTTMTDFAVLNEGYLDETYSRTADGKQTCNYFTRDTVKDDAVLQTHDGNEFVKENAFVTSTGIKFGLQLDIEQAVQYIKNSNLRLKKKKLGKNTYHKLQMAELPASRVNDKQNQQLEKLFNNGKLDEKLVSTGRMWTVNGETIKTNWAPKQIPEFQLKDSNDRYARVTTIVKSKSYADGTEIQENEEVRWVKIEPISFIVKNWDDLPKSINKKGSENAKTIELMTEHCVLAGMEFYPGFLYAKWKDSRIRGYLNGINVNKKSNDKSLDLKGGNFEGENNLLNQAFNLARQPIYDYTVGKDEIEIAKNAFAGCVHLNSITLHNDIEHIGEQAFDCISFKYISKTKEGELVLSKQPLEKEVEEVYEFSVFSKAFEDFDLRHVINNKISLKTLHLIAHRLSSAKAKIPYDMAETIITNNQGESFASSNFKAFKNVQKLIPDDIIKYDKQAFYIFAYNIGCFSSDLNLNNKANVWLKERLTSKQVKDKTTGKRTTAEPDLYFDEMRNIFGDWAVQGENEEFSQFLFGKNPETNVPVFQEIQNQSNWKLLLYNIFEEYSDTSQELSSGGRFRDSKTGKLMFSVVRKSSENHNAKLKVLKPTVELFKQQFFQQRFKGVETELHQAVAEELDKWGQEYRYFNIAKEIMDEFVKRQVPTNILGKHLKEDIHSEIKDYTNQTSQLYKHGITTAKDIIGKLSHKIEKEFTYDWLEKNDPKNLCLGLYCDCCAHILGAGHTIMKSSILHPDVQTLAVLDKTGQPIGKATIYVNRKEGYGAFNTFELKDGNYDKEQVYQTFYQGTEDFAREYNRKNPDKPIKKITIGMDYNDLYHKILEGQKPSDIVKTVYYLDMDSDIDIDWVEDQVEIWRHDEATLDTGEMER